METTTIATSILTPNELLKNWQAHRQLTRRVIDAFPEKELFEFSIGGMRTFADIVKELLAIAVPGLKQIATDIPEVLDEKRDDINTKAALLEAWDASTEQINIYWKQLSMERFRETINLFGQFSSPVIVNIFYFVDNEIHHRGQGYVYLRALGIEPPPFWDRY